MYDEYLNSNVPQNEKAKEDQVKNNAGGYVFKIDELEQLKRFLILGSEKGTYYVSSRSLSVENLNNIRQLLNKRPNECLSIAAEFSADGRIIKNETAIAVLALGLSHEDIEVRRLSSKYVSVICRIPTHIFTLLKYLKNSGLRGLGRLPRKVISNWYLDKSFDKLIYHMLKYQSRNNWSHKDVLRTIHIKPKDEEIEQLFGWILGKKDPPNHSLINDFIKLRQNNISTKDVVNIIKNNKSITWEFIPTKFLKEKEVWEALLPNLPYTALIRNLGRMGAIGLITPLSDISKYIQKRLENLDEIKRQLVHPAVIFKAFKQYQFGRSNRGKLNWTIDEKISESLENAFEISFRTIEPTNKNILIGIDVSASMIYHIVDNIKAVECAALMAMIFVRNEKNVHTMAFSHEFQNFPITKNSSIQQIIMQIRDMNFGATDCALPMLYAIKHNIDNIDVFMVLTDNETWYGEIHPFEALKKYRKKFNRPKTKLVVVACESTHFSIADPDDPYMADFVGFDTALPKAVQEFIKL